jgi:cation transport ATPase
LYLEIKISSHKDKNWDCSGSEFEKIKIDSSAHLLSCQYRKKAACLLLNTIKKRGEGKMIAFIGINRIVVGAIIFGDKIRLGVNVMMQRLQRLGVKETVMLRGDSFEPSLQSSRSDPQSF